MKFPVLEISVKNWDKFKEFDVQFDENLMIASEQSLKNNFLHSEYIDCNGHIFRVAGYELPKGLKRILCFIPLLPFPAKLIFEKTGKTLSLNDFKALVLNRIMNEPGYIDMVEIVNQAKTHEEVMA